MHTWQNLTFKPAVVGKRTVLRAINTAPSLIAALFQLRSRRAAGRVCKLLSLRIPRVHEEPGALPDHGGQGRNQGHQVRADTRLLAVQIARRHRAGVRLCGRHAGAVRLPRPAAFIPGAPEPQSVRVRVPAERTGTLRLARHGAQPRHLLPHGAAVRAHTAARRILVASAGTGSPLLQLHRTHARQHVQLAQRAACLVNSLF